MSDENIFFYFFLPGDVSLIPYVYDIIRKNNILYIINNIRKDIKQEEAFRRVEKNKKKKLRVRNNAHRWKVNCLSILVWIFVWISSPQGDPS